MPATQTAAPPVPFRDVLRQGSRGTQPVAVKRGLFRAGFHEGWHNLDDPAIAAEVLGDLGVHNLRIFERYNGLEQDGIYGPKAHAILRGSFDAYARFLYSAPSHVTLQLPATFTPTHDTAGLPGFPAIDNFAPAGSTVGAPEAGTITRFSGHDPREGGPAGGPYGWSMYLTCPSAIYYLTHFGSRLVSVGQKVKHGDLLGTVCDGAVTTYPDGRHVPTSTSHIHEGKHEL